ncbi:anti-sigma factor [Rhizobium sp. S95]|uniref:Anti-sigma factor n=1 Tax=Ciceribacter sichuanensis TaxID=2949647 RepID=A0AAJ1FI71_9HYPH|nr:MULTISPECIES: anti-sigma factor [unclassified Ciceribacter]MCM2399148.1 anti-sigma factor [Ciceribacter sp. S95]MCO5956646.1 anti-sigma factor [Ciceribacter sp. S101]
MTQTLDTVDDGNLHAYVDGLLDEKRRAEVEAWLADHPDEAAKVADWQRQNADIRELFRDYERHEETDRSMLARHRSAAGRNVSIRAIAMRVAAAVALFTAGIAVGRFTPPAAENVPVQVAVNTASLQDQARSAFLIYANDVRHPVEVGADQQEHLATWLGKRLDYPMRIPDLSAVGMKLVGGRLVPVSGKAGALLMYEDTSGERITVLVGRNEDNRETSFRYASDEGLETFYWIDGPVGYAVTGEISRERMQQIADECYRQFDS